MGEAKLTKRFGMVAIEKRFITKDQFVEAMAVQIENELGGIQPKNLGTILNAMGYMTHDQIQEVVKVMGIPFKKA